MSSNTVRLHRVLRTTPEKIYRAFTDAEAMSKWLPPHGFTCRFDKLEPKVGGAIRFSFTNFTSKKGHICGGKYLELAPHERVRYTGYFEDPKLPGEMVTTVTLKKVLVGTELSIVQEGIPASIPAEACYLGWQDSLDQLANLSEPDIQD